MIKGKRSGRFCPGVIAVAMLTALSHLTGTAQAATLYWDANGATAGSGNVGGTWVSSFWTTSSAGTGTPGLYSTLAESANDVYFSAGTDATGSNSVTGITSAYTSSKTVNKLTVEEGIVVLTGQNSSQALTLSGAGEISAASGATLAGNLVFTGSAGLVKTGDGTLQLSRSNTYSGATWIKAGTVRTGLTGVPSGAIPDSSSVTIDSGATLTTDNNGSGRAEVIGSLAGAGSLALRGPSSGDIAFASGGNNASTEFSGVISSSSAGVGDGQFVKQGTGVLTLSGANTYRLETLVSAGTLLVNGTHASVGANEIGAYFVASDATLGGTGSIGTNVTLNAGAILAADSLTVASLFMADGSKAKSDYGDVLTVTGAATVDGTWYLTGNWSGLTGNSVQLYNVAGTVTDSGLAVDASGATGKDFTGWTMNTTTGVFAIPEPATIGMLGLGALMTIMIRRHTVFRR